MTITQVVEDALRGYVPPGTALKAGRLVQGGPILVRPSNGTMITLTEADAALNEVREHLLDD